jgi:hypothetical protein
MTNESVTESAHLEKIATRFAEIFAYAFYNTTGTGSPLT